MDARRWPALDRFTVTYEAPNYVYIEEINVEVLPIADFQLPNGDRASSANGQSTIGNRPSDASVEGATPLSSPLAEGGGTPAVVATRRLDNGPPEVVEIVLDRAIPYNATTRFTFNDGALEQSVDFTYAPGDTDGDADLYDFAALANCFGPLSEVDLCPLFDRDADAAVTLADYSRFHSSLAP